VETLDVVFVVHDPRWIGVGDISPHTRDALAYVGQKCKALEDVVMLGQR